MKKISKPVLILLIALPVLLAGVGAFFALFAPMGGHWFRKDSSSITTDIVDREALSAFPHLKVLSALEADLTVKEAAAIQRQYPNTELVWSVPLKGGKVSSASDAVTLTAEEDFALLPCFTNLGRVQAEGEAVCPALLEAAAAMPGCAFAYQVPLGENTYPMDAAALTLTSVEEVEGLTAALPYFTALKQVDVSACPLSCEQLAALKEALNEVELTCTLSAFGEVFPGDSETVALPEGSEPSLEALVSLGEALPRLKTLDLTLCKAGNALVAALVQACPDLQVLWTDASFGASDSAARSLTLPDGSPEALLSYLSCFPRLESADVTALPLHNGAISELVSAFPQVDFAYMVEMDGEKIASDVRELNWDNRQVQDLESLHTGLPLLKQLKKITLHFCSLSNEELAALRAENPRTKVVWSIRLTHKLVVPTDAVAFSTMSGGTNANRLTSAKVADLQYCTELIALDLGHNAISDLSWLEPLTNLQVLILADNKITDMTSIGKLTRLKYLELFMNKVRDISAVANLTELLDFNMCWTKVSDVTPLLSCRKLERIWLASCSELTEEGKQTLLDAFPNAAFDFESPSCTRKGWREHPRYEAFRKMFETNTPVSPFLPEE